MEGEAWRQDGRTRSTHGPQHHPVPGQPPPCSWPGPAGAAAPPPRCSAARPAPPQAEARSPLLLRRLGAGRTRDRWTRNQGPGSKRWRPQRGKAGASAARYPPPRPLQAKPGANPEEPGLQRGVKADPPAGGTKGGQEQTADEERGTRVLRTPGPRPVCLEVSPRARQEVLLPWSPLSPPPTLATKDRGPEPQFPGARGGLWLWQEQLEFTGKDSVSSGCGTQGSVRRE